MRFLNAIGAHRALVLLVGISLGCARSHYDGPSPSDPSPDGAPTRNIIDAGGASNDAGRSSEPPDAGISVADAGRLPVAGRERACDLTDEDLVAASLRARACVETYTVSIFHDFARGFAYDESNHHSYSDLGFGNCHFARCLAEAPDCEFAIECFAGVIGRPCDESERSFCDGDHVMDCRYFQQREARHVIRAQDCSRVGMVCQEGDGGASCALPVGEPEERCGGGAFSGYGFCDGDDAVRCVGNHETGYFDRIACDELIEGGTCFELPIGGEAPGAHCLRADECWPDYEPPRCTSEFDVQLCVHGQRQTFDCRDYGYNACRESNEGRRRDACMM